VQLTVRFNNRGFTLIEVMVALVILAISSMAILNAMVLAMQQNLGTYSRDEAVRIAEQSMNEMRDAPFSTLSSGNFSIDRTFKNSTRRFSVSRTVESLSTDSRSIQIQVTWIIKNKSFTHSITSIVVNRSA
jgi:prepilin-type N-terminal cleavage/methylation domain-containing protein